MKIYAIEAEREDGTTFTSLTASEYFAQGCIARNKDWKIKSVIEWDVKTEGKNVHNWGKPKTMFTKVKVAK